MDILCCRSFGYSHRYIVCDSSGQTRTGHENQVLKHINPLDITRFMIDAKLEHVLLERNVFEGILQLVGDLTTVKILFELVEQDMRFMELHKAVGVSSKTLSARLKELQGEQLVVKTLYAEVPPRSVYSLTEKGAELVSIMKGILEWDSTWKSR